MKSMYQLFRVCQLFLLGDVNSTKFKFGLAPGTLANNFGVFTANAIDRTTHDSCVFFTRRIPSFCCVNRWFVAKEKAKYIHNCLLEDCFAFAGGTFNVASQWKDSVFHSKATSFECSAN